MALISCPECSTQVSNAAVSCPKCGCPIAESVRGAVGKTDKPKPKKAPMSTGLKVALGVLFMIFGLFVIFIWYWSEPSVNPDLLSHEDLCHRAMAYCSGNESKAAEICSGHDYCPERGKAVYACLIEHGDCLYQRECKAVSDVWSQCTYCGVWKETGSNQHRKAKCDPFRDELVLREEPTAAANVADLTDDELCAWICGNCYGEAVGLKPYPGDCHSDCKALLTTQPCSAPERGMVLCKVRNKDCRACRAEHRAIDQCLENCDRLKRQHNYDSSKIPEHCKVRE